MAAHLPAPGSGVSTGDDVSRLRRLESAPGSESFRALAGVPPRRCCVRCGGLLRPVAAFMTVVIVSSTEECPGQRMWPSYGSSCAARFCSVSSRGQ